MKNDRDNDDSADIDDVILKELILNLGAFKYAIKVQHPASIHIDIRLVVI